MSFNINTLPKFEKELKALSKKYISLKKEYSELLDALEKKPFFRNRNWK